MFSQDNIVQTNTGTFEGTSGSATLPEATTAGSTVLIFAGVAGDFVNAYSISTPATFNLVGSSTWGGTKRGYARCFMQPSSPGSESSWTLTVNGGSQQVCWVALEVTGVDLDVFLAVNGWPGIYLEKADNAFDTTTSSRGSGTTDPSESFGALAFVFHEATSTDTTVPVLSGHTNGFYEIAAANHANGTRAMAASLAAKATQSLGAVSSTVSISPASYAYGMVLVLTGVDSKHAPNVEACSGLEIGSVTSIATLGENSLDGAPPWDVIGGSPAVVTTNARTGNYCAELSSVAAAEYLGMTTNSGRGNLDRLQAAPPLGVGKVYIHYPTILPVLDTEILSLEAGSAANGVVVRYIASSGKLGAKIGTATEVISDAAISADTHIGIDFLYDPRTSAHTFDWAIDYDGAVNDTVAAVAQTQATATGMTGAAINGVFVGWKNARTATMRFDDFVFCRNRKAYPIGPINVRPLKVDPAGTIVVGGDSANFKVMTSNGSMATWDATNARNAIDDVPPTIGGSSDGIAQVNVATSDYVEIPMQTFDAAGLHAHRAARWYWAPWGSSGNPCTCVFGIADTGGILTNISPLADHGADDTTLLWLTGMHKSSASQFYVMDQTKVDALRCYWGFSTDANPDVGIHTVLVELVTAPVVVLGSLYVADADGNAHQVYVRQDPLSASVVSYLITTPPGSRGATFTATIDGSDFSHHVDANTTYEKVVSASDISQVTACGLTPD